MKEKTKKSILTFGLIGAGFIALMSLFKGKSSIGDIGGVGSGGGVNFDVLSAVKPDLRPSSSFDNVSPYKPDSIDNGMDNLDINGNVNPPTNIKKANIGVNELSASGAVDEVSYNKNQFGLSYEKIGDPNDWYFTRFYNNGGGFYAKNVKTGGSINLNGLTPNQFIAMANNPNSDYYNPLLADSIQHANKYGLKYSANPNNSFNDKLDVGKLSKDKLLDNDDNSGSVGGSYVTQTVNRIMSSDDPYREEIAKNTVELDQDLRKRGSSLEQAHEKHKPNLKGSVYKSEEEYWQAMGNIGKRH